MKGITHFVSGIAVATFFPDAVHQAADGSLILALGGLFGLLPDTLDFKIIRYLEAIDTEIDPDPHAPQPQAIADQVAGVMQAAFESDEPKTIMLHTARLGADLWREYSLRFRPETSEVMVQIGPLVNTSQAPLPGSTPVANIEGRATVGVPMVHTYDAEVRINVFSGPAFRFERHRTEPITGHHPESTEGADDVLCITFLPWHRSWTHSLTLAAALGLGMGLLLGPTAGLVSGLGFATHVLEDQLGHMGSNLCWPITKRRTGGLGFLRSGDGLPNFLTVWLALALIIFNLDRFSVMPRLPVISYLLVAVLLPSITLGTLYKWNRRRGTKKSVEALRQGDILAEAQEVEL
jgi:membrane-bound metal-dependent hydrolase YbcI (DUF457 family)